MRYFHSYCISLLLLTLSFTATGSAAEYFLSSGSGSDVNPGTSPNEAWATFTRLEGVELRPGDTVRLKRGDVWRETLDIRAKGAPEAPVTFSDYGDTSLPRPLVLGADRYDAWEEVGPRLHRVWIPFEPPINHVVLRGGEGDVKLARHKGMKDPAADLVAGEYGTVPGEGGQHLYVRHASLPAAYADVSVRDHGVQGGGGHVVLENIDVQVTRFANIYVNGDGNPWVIRDLEVRYGWGSNRRTPGAGIEVRAVPYSVIDNVTVRDAHGDGIFVRCRHVTVRNSRVYTVYKGWNPGGDCIQFSSGKTDGFRILNNWVTQEGTDTPKGCIQQEFGDNGIIRGNTVLFGVFGIEFNGNNVVVEDNVVAFAGHGDRKGRDPFSAGIFMSEHRGYDDILIRDNIVYNCDVSGISLDATNGRKFPPYNRTNVRVVNNTVVGSRYGFRSTVPFSGEIVNNLFADIGGPVVDIAALVYNHPFRMEHNLVPPKNGTYYRIGNDSYDSPAAFPSAEGPEGLQVAAVAGLDGNSPGIPQNVTPDTPLPEFTPPAGSPAVDGGTYLGLRTDIRGNGVDIGAVESGHRRGSVPDPAPAPTGLTATALAQDEIRLQWTPLDLDAYAGVRIHRARDPGFTPSEDNLLVPLHRGNRHYDTHRLASGGTYTYKLVPANSAGGLSEPVSVTASTLAPPDGFIAYDGFRVKTRGSVPLDGLDTGEGFAGPWRAPERSGLGGASPARGGLETLGRVAEVWDTQSRDLADRLHPARETLWLGFLLGASHSSKQTHLALTEGGAGRLAVTVRPDDPVRLGGSATERRLDMDLPFCLLKLEPHAGGVKSSLWVNPELGDGPPASEPDAVHLDAEPWSFDGISVGFSHSSDHKGMVDEIRIGRNYHNAVRSHVPDTIPPLPPEELVGEPDGTSRIRLRWNPVQVSDLDHYVLYRARVGDAVQPARQPHLLAIADAHVTDDRDLTPGAGYVYRVVAVDAAGNASPPSEPLTVTVPDITGTLLVYEGFDREDGAEAFGWAEESWTFSHPKESGVVGGSLKLAGVENHGGKLSVVGAAERALDPPLSMEDGTLWLGVALECRNSGRTGMFQLLDGGEAVLTFTHRPTRLLEVNGEKTDVRGNKGHQFYLVKLVNGRATVWLDPDPAAGPPDPRDALASVPLAGDRFDAVRILHNPASLFSTFVDEIRIGARFPDAFRGTGRHRAAGRLP